MLPVIGITCLHNYQDMRMQQSDAYVESVKQGGGVPVLLPSVDQEPLMDVMLGRIDGLLVAGGPDVHPLNYGAEPERNLGTISPLMDAFEITLVQRAVAKGIPVLGICRGIQVLNVAMGGTLYQDIGTDISDALQHRQLAARDFRAHSIKIDKDSQLAHIFASEHRRVNTFHHQAVKSVAPGFRATAFAPDGVIEGIETTKTGVFVLGVQWHPEMMWRSKESDGALFKAFVEYSKLKK